MRSVTHSSGNSWCPSDSGTHSDAYDRRTTVEPTREVMMNQARDALYRRVRRWTSGYTSLWFNASGNPPLHLRSFSRQEQCEREKQVDVMRREGSLSPTGGSASERGQGRKRIMALIAQGIPGPAGVRVRRFLDHCGRAGERFVGRARSFNAGISDAEIQQALRNLWVFNSLQFYLGKPVVLTPSSFAYSLLYPYTDNWLDEAAETCQGKQSLMRWLTSQLHGYPSSTDDGRKEAIASLLRMIRQEFPRSRRPEVHASLLAIHRAQKKALRLCGAPSTGSEHSLIPLTMEKGGTSVLVDGLLAGRLSTAQAEAIFGYGILLQLVDDLQDLQEDLDGSRSSPFSRAIRHGTLEGVTNRLFNLTEVIAARLKREGLPASGDIAPLIARSCTILIEEAIARHSHLYRQGYLALVNRHTPVRLAYLREFRHR